MLNVLAGLLFPAMGTAIKRIVVREIGRCPGAQGSDGNRHSSLLVGSRPLGGTSGILAS